MRKCPFSSATGKKISSRGTRELHTHCQREENHQSKENRDRSIAKNNAGNREHFELWFGNVETFTPDKFIELQVLLQQANILPHIIALTEAKPKHSVIKWNPIWQKLDSYILKEKNMNSNEKGILI